MSSEKNPDTVVLIHGLWMTALSWEHWVDRYERAGYKVVARSWPGMDGDIDQLRKDPSGVANLGIADIVDFYAELIQDLPTPPIIMGHSFGGAFTEILVDRGLGAAGVAIDAAGLRGIFKLPFSELRSGFPVLKNPLNRHHAVALTPAEFHYAFGNTLSEQDSNAAFERYAVPGPGRVLFEGALANFNPRSPDRVSFANGDRAPLLIISGGADHTVPAVVDKAAAANYEKSEALTEYKEYPGRSHWTIAEPGWEEVADYALTWAAEHARNVVPA